MCAARGGWREPLTVCKHAMECGDRATGGQRGPSDIPPFQAPRTSVGTGSLALPSACTAQKHAATGPASGGVHRKTCGGRLTCAARPVRTEPPAWVDRRRDRVVDQRVGREASQHAGRSAFHALLQPRQRTLHRSLRSAHVLGQGGRSGAAGRAGPARAPGQAVGRCTAATFRSPARRGAGRTECRTPPSAAQSQAQEGPWVHRPAAGTRAPPPAAAAVRFVAGVDGAH